eukprot:6246402-Alexandrium_andersonii.AAC.1
MHTGLSELCKYTSHHLPPPTKLKSPGSAPLAPPARARLESTAVCKDLPAPTPHRHDYNSTTSIFTS